MDENTHVYCTNCEHYKLSIVDCLDNLCKQCPCRNCDCEEPEDSIPFYKRKYYVEKSK